jgi:hypothetical protein
VWQESNTAFYIFLQRTGFAGSESIGIQGGKQLVVLPQISARRISFFGCGQAMTLAFHLSDLDTLLDHAGITNNVYGLDIAIRGRDSKGDSGEVFYGNSKLFTRESEAVKLPVYLSSGSWSLAATPEGGWKKNSPYETEARFSLFFGLVTALTAAMLLRKLKGELVDNRNQLKAMSQANHDPLIMIGGEEHARSTT